MASRLASADTGSRSDFAAIERRRHRLGHALTLHLRLVVETLLEATAHPCVVEIHRRVAPRLP